MSISKHSNQLIFEIPTSKKRSETSQGESIVNRVDQTAPLVTDRFEAMLMGPAFHWTFGLNVFKKKGWFQLGMLGVPMDGKPERCSEGENNFRSHIDRRTASRYCYLLPWWQQAVQSAGPRVIGKQGLQRGFEFRFSDKLTHETAPRFWFGSKLIPPVG
jgi:hypothetical protein